MTCLSVYFSFDVSVSVFVLLGCGVEVVGGIHPSWC